MSSQQYELSHAPEPLPSQYQPQFAVTTSQPLPPIPPGAVLQQMPPPEPMPGVPLGLEYLSAIDELTIKQAVNVAEAVTGIEFENKFQIFNAHGQQVYFAKEQSTFFQRQCCGSDRGFTMQILDNFQQSVINLERPFKCCRGCYCCADAACCQYPIYVKDKGGVPLGMLRSLNWCCLPHFGIFSETGTLLYRISGPCCPFHAPCGCTGDRDFKICEATTGTETGSLTKKYGGFAREVYTDASTFSLKFPINLNPNHKALMLAATFLLDMSLYERSDK